MSLLGKVRYPAYDEKCRLLASEDKVRFAGVLDKYGQLVAGGFKEGLVPLESDKQRLYDFTRFVSEVSLRKELDRDLGPINYLAARRDKIILISFPFPLANMTLLISADKTMDIERLASHVVDVFSRDQARIGDQSS